MYSKIIKSFSGSINENKLDIVPSDVRSAFFKFISHDEDLNKINSINHREIEDQLLSDPNYTDSWFDEIVSLSDVYLIDTKGGLISNEYRYVIKISNLKLNLYKYYIYDESSKSFISSEEIKYNKNTSMCDYLSERDRSVLLEVSYRVIYEYTGEDWIKNRTKTINATKKINENIFIYYVPKHIQSAYLSYIGGNEKLNDLNKEEYEWRLEDGNYSDDEDRDGYNCNVYLMNTDSSIYSIGYDYLIKFEVFGDDINSFNEYLVYDKSVNKFVNTTDIECSFDSSYDTIFDYLSSLESMYVSITGIYTIIGEFGYSEWVNLTMKTRRAIVKMNENSHIVDLDVPSDVRNAFLSYIIGNKKFNEVNLEDYRWRSVTKINGRYLEDDDREGFINDIMLFDTERDSRVMGYEYLIKYCYQESGVGDSYIEYFVYDPSTKKFIDGDDINYDINSQINTLSDYIRIMEKSMFLEDRYKSIGDFIYDDWKINYEKTLKVLKKINEDVDIFGVDDNRDVPLDLSDVPSIVKTEYLKLIHTLMKAVENQLRSMGVDISNIPEDDKKRCSLYLIDCSDLFIDKDNGSEDYKYLIKYNGFNIPQCYYYVFSEGRKRFINTETINYSNVSRKNTSLFIQYYKHDKYMKLEYNKLIDKFSYEDWLNITERSIKAIKKINEMFVLVTPFR